MNKKQKHPFTFYLLCTLGGYIVICFFTHTSLLWLPNSIFYLFSKNREILSIDDSQMTVDYIDSELSDQISCENYCELENAINYISISGYLFNSYSKVTAVLNDEYPLKVEKYNEENSFFWKDTYKLDKFIARLDIEKINLKKGENKIVVSSDNKTDVFIFYYN